jgi:methionyl-tRNA formyltransferase
MQKINVAFLGGRVLGHRCLKQIYEYRDKINVRFVIAHKKDGEYGSDWNPPLLPLAKELGYDILKCNKLTEKNVYEIFRTSKIDLIINVFCDRIIPRRVLEIPRLGAINFHYGKLPDYKGRFIVTHTILNNESETCAVVHYIDENIDTGDIIFEMPVVVYPDDTAKTLYFRCTDAASKLFVNVLDYLVEGRQFPRRKQQGSGTYYPYEAPNNCKIDLGWDKEKLERFIRAVTFEPISRPWMEVNGLKFDVVQSVR